MTDPLFTCLDEIRRCARSMEDELLTRDLGEPLRAWLAAHLAGIQASMAELAAKAKERGEV